MRYDPIALRLLRVLLICCLVIGCVPANHSTPITPPAPDIGIPLCEDSSILAYTSYVNGNEDIYLACTDGSGDTRLTFDPANDKFPAWSPDGERILFTSYRYRNDDIFVMNANGGGLINVTNHPAEDNAPAWSPDGTRIAFVSDRDGDQEIYLVNSDGTGLINLTQDAADDHSPVWSPDGTRIAFVKYDYALGNAEIYIMNSDGTGQRNLTADPSDDISPAWSPDGNRIAFVSRRTGNDEIFTISPDSTDLVNLSNNPTDDELPTWSPDGSRIAYVSMVFHSYEIFLVNRDGTGNQNLTRNGADDLHPAWSPDGNWIAFRSTRDWNDEIYVMAVDGSTPVNLSNSYSAEGFPAWRPASSSAVFLAQDEGTGMTPTPEPNASMNIIDSDGIPWAPVPGSQQILMDGFRLDYQPNAPISVRENRVVVEAEANQGFGSSIGLLSLEGSGDFGFSVSLNKSVDAYSSITLSEAWHCCPLGWQLGKRINLVYLYDQLILEVFTQTDPGSYYYFPTPHTTGWVTLEFRRIGDRFVMLENGNLVGEVHDSGLFTDKPLTISVSSDPFSEPVRLEIKDFLLETPLGQESNAQLLRPWVTQPFTFYRSEDPNSLRSNAQTQGRYVGTLASSVGTLDVESLEILPNQFNLAALSGSFDYYHNIDRTTYTFTGSDGGFDGALGFARANGMQTYAHLGIGPQIDPAPWLVVGTFSREDVLRVVREYVRTVIAHGRGQVMAWIAVNEPTAEDGIGLRDTFWLRTIGPEYMDLIFRWAHEYDPLTRLLINDWTIAEGNDAKAQDLLLITQALVDQHTPVSGVGFESHLALGEPWRPQDVSARMQQFDSLGLEVWITEMDMEIKWGTGTLEDRLADEARIYGEMTQVCLDAPNCRAISFWGFTDKYSGIYSQAGGSPDAPAIFDENNQPKPAYYAILDALLGR